MGSANAVVGRGSWTVAIMSGASAEQQPSTTSAARRADADPVDEVAQAFQQLEAAMRRSSSSTAQLQQVRMIPLVALTLLSSSVARRTSTPACSASSSCSSN